MNLQTFLQIELWDAVRTNYERENFSGSILDASYFLSDLLRQKSGVDGDGATLVGQALGGSNPKIKIGKDQSETELNKQRGFEQILRGLYQAIRNPRSHEKTLDTREDAIALIVFINFLVGTITNAKSQFSVKDFIKRVLEKDFVPSERYAALLYEEIPLGQRLEVFFSLYQEKEKWIYSGIPIFFNVMFSSLNGFELKQIYDIVSSDFKSIDDVSTMDNMLRCLPFNIWSEIDESAALRIENKMIKSLASGKFTTSSNTITPDRLGTFTPKYYKNFRLKRELINSIRVKLWSDDEASVSYIQNYILLPFSRIEPTIPPSIDSLLANRIKSNNKESYRNLTIYSNWGKSVWSAILTSEVVAYEQRHPSTDNWDDKIPF